MMAASSFLICDADFNCPQEGLSFGGRDTFSQKVSPAAAGPAGTIQLRSFQPVTAFLLSALWCPIVTDDNVAAYLLISIVINALLVSLRKDVTVNQRAAADPHI